MIISLEIAIPEQIMLGDRVVIQFGRTHRSIFLICQEVPQRCCAASGNIPVRGLRGHVEQRPQLFLYPLLVRIPDDHRDNAQEPLVHASDAVKEVCVRR